MSREKQIEEMAKLLNRCAAVCEDGCICSEKEHSEVLYNAGYRKQSEKTVEVVRCKDCKHSRERNENERKYLVEGVLICTSGEAADECWNPVYPSHFCSYGERRE